MPKGNKVIAIYIGYFDIKKQTFSWDKYREYKTFQEAEREFDTFCKKCFEYTYDEFIQEFGTPRMDVEIRQGSKMLKWFGLYEQQNALEVSEELEEEQE